MSQLTPAEKQVARELWLPVPYPAFAHYDVSTEGRVRNRITKEPVKPYLHGSDYQLWVRLAPAKGFPDPVKRFRLARLVFEAHRYVKLPKFTAPKYKNGNVEDNRLANLLPPDGFVMPAEPVASVKVLPTVRPAINLTEPIAPPAAPPAVNGPALTPRQIDYARRYEAHLTRMRDAFDLATVGATIDELIQLRVIETDFLDALEGYPPEKTAALVYRLFALILEDK